MTINIMFSAGAARWAEYETHLRLSLEDMGLDYRLDLDLGPPDAVDYVIYAPNSALQDFTPYIRCKAVLNLWAGVEEVVDNPTLTQPLARMVDDGLTQGMVEWVTGHVLRHHLGMDAQIRKEGDWNALRIVPPLASQRRVTILGLGALGATVGQALAGLGFDVVGWSRSAKHVSGVTCLFGTDGLQEALSGGQILVLLLPQTSKTENLLDATRLAQMPKGAVVINPGRGPLINDEALLAALDSDHLDHATLDVFWVEPLPNDHVFWTHPKVTVTPHIASETRANTASHVIAENIRRGEAGEPFLHLVDRQTGY
ncbi:glyoxylate/hydroxypyruvate reductase A [Actibacterium sp. 188UL27-1]|uniref:2-hydroxyacid dehydrogenase n=1 Tax=Actibacterium sp. 188UL27-1 TaxID=2786961 RepID=UPI00195F0365|nr:glyoxylate/hydroxypyruvate reductase A [Actibacterium sp. 188UL27-1]MBM7066573.1 glyoxylate/hydroxypyruvate reductase A [Actibacterium sp. 188UL27-1]